MGALRSEGFNGRIMLETAAGGAPTTISDMVSWALDVSVDNWEAPGLEDVWKVTMRGLKGWGGSLEGYWKKESDSGSEETIWHWLHELANADTEYRIGYLYPNAKNDPTRYFYGSMAITAFSTSPPMADAIK